MVRGSDSPRRNIGTTMTPTPAASPPSAPPAGPEASTRAFRYEHFSQPVMPRHRFRVRVAKHVAVAAAMVSAALAIGVAGYMFIAGMRFVDAFLDASMILSGMGPVGELKTDAAKYFAAFYALFSGLVFIATSGLLVVPIAHRLLHKLHCDTQASGG